VIEHPSYDAFWQDQAMDRILGGQPLKVPVMLVHSLWDQEDIYGAMRGSWDGNMGWRRADSGGR